MPETETFWACMSEPSDASTLAEALFDKDGNLRKKYYERTGAKGSGVWGPELNFANILLVKELYVNPNWRRRGLGRKLVRTVLKMHADRSMYTTRWFSYALPGSLEWETGSYDEQVDVAVKFWRSIRYRRIGSSEWFALSDLNDHPSRFLAAGDDFDPGRSVSQDAVPWMAKEAFLVLSNEGVTDSQSLAYLEAYFPDDTADATWTSTDPEGDSILHIAARGFKPECAKYILSRVPELAACRNNEGSTPLELLDDAMESVREPFREIARGVSGTRFTGFSHRVVACFGVLAGKEVTELPDVVPEGVLSSLDWVANRGDIVHGTLRIKYGCTCGECVAGFLSPRLKYKLIVGSHQVERSSAYAGGLSTRNMCKCIRYCLWQRKVPTDTNVRAFWAAVCGGDQLLDGAGESLAAGKLVEVLGEIFGCVRSDSSWGPEVAGVQSRPACRNDSELEFVQGMCAPDLAG